MSEKLFDALDLVTDSTSFIKFLNLLYQDRLEADESETSIDGFELEWANNELSSFFEATLAWAEDTEFIKRESKSANPWKAVADLLIAGRGYE